MMRGSDTKHNLNMRGAFLHVVSDMLGSVAAIGAALIMIFFGWAWADPLASVIVAALVLRSGFQVSRSSLHVLMEGAPLNIRLEDIAEEIVRTEGVNGVHDVHIWSITSGMHALTAHIVVDGGKTVAEAEQIVHRIEHMLHHKGIRHVTLQVESDGHRHDESLLCGLPNGRSS